MRPGLAHFLKKTIKAAKIGFRSFLIFPEWICVSEYSQKISSTTFIIKQ